MKYLKSAIKTLTAAPNDFRISLEQGLDLYVDIKGLKAYCYKNDLDYNRVMRDVNSKGYYQFPYGSIVKNVGV